MQSKFTIKVNKLQKNFAGEMYWKCRVNSPSKYNKLQREKICGWMLARRDKFHSVYASKLQSKWWICCENNKYKSVCVRCQEEWVECSTNMGENTEINKHSDQFRDHLEPRGDITCIVHCKGRDKKHRGVKKPKEY
jgi:hypothetical protein